MAAVAMYRFTSGRPTCAVAFQSMSLTSSPTVYSRRSSKSMLRPRWIERCSPSIRSADGLAGPDCGRLDLAEEGLPTHDRPLRGRDGGEDGVDDRLDGTSSATAWNPSRMRCPSTS